MQKQPIQGADLKVVDSGGRGLCVHVRACACVCVLVLVFKGGWGEIDCNNVFFGCSGEEART